MIGLQRGYPSSVFPTGLLVFVLHPHPHPYPVRVRFVPARDFCVSVLTVCCVLPLLLLPPLPPRPLLLVLSSSKSELLLVRYQRLTRLVLHSRSLLFGSL